MNLNITGQQMELTATLKDFITQRFDQVSKHCQDITNAHVICKVQRELQLAEAKIHIPGAEIFAHSSSENMYKTIDLLIEKLIRQVDKHREKNQGK
jgi:putative sigma-54 modulation protein